MENEKTGKAERLFSEMGRKIDEILENTKGNTQEIKSDIKERLEELKKSKEKLETEFHEFTSNKDGKWTDVKHHLGQALNEVKGALDAILKKEKPTE